MDLGEWLDTWLALYVAPSGLALSTIACYRRAVDALPDEIARCDMARLTALDLMPWLVAVAKEHPRAAQLDRAMLSKALHVAYKLGLCPGCVIDHDTLPQAPHAPKTARVLALDEVPRYLTAAQEQFCYPLLCLCLCGLRRGEALGARWADYDGAVLRVERQRLRIDGQYRTLPLKTAKSNRCFVVPELLRNVLAVWPRSITGWIVDTTPEALHKAHKAALAAAGLDTAVTLHGLRHTIATLAAAQGVPLKLLQVAMGHSKAAVTADLYADHLPALSSVQSLVWQGFAGRVV